MGYLLEKIHTLIDVASQPSFFGKYRSGIIPTTYCRLNQPWLQERNFGTILDIGANVGRFSLTANAVFPYAAIEAFEPLPSCFDAAAKALKPYANARVHNVALGDEDGEIEMFANNFSPSSSILPMADTHKEAFPFTEHGKMVPIKVQRLDDIAPKLNLADSLFVKIDVQGFERQVLAGGRETIRKAGVVLLELSFEELYEGQPLFEELLDTMRALGFTFRGTMAQMGHPKDGRTLDADCFFVKA
jgi:FkbM family methyltransferase